MCRSPRRNFREIYRVRKLIFAPKNFHKKHGSLRVVRFSEFFIVLFPDIIFSFL